MLYFIIGGVMKKKIYFIIASIIQILVSIYSIINAKAISEKLLSTLEMLPEAMQERVNNLYQNAGIKYITILSIVCIIIDLLIILMAARDKLSLKKGVIITLSVITLFTASYSIVELIAIINIIVAATIKNDKINEKKEIPKIKKENVDKKKVLMAVGLLLIYFSQMVWGDFIPTGVIGILIQVVFYILMIILSLWVFKDKLINDFKLFKDNFSVYIGYILPRMGIFYVIFIVVSLICMMITKSTANNQNLVEEIPLVLSLPLAIIYAPIVEESLFRGCIRRFIRNDKVFIIVSGIVFGLLHTIFAESNMLNLIVLAIPYGVMGSFLAYLYVDTNNILSNITYHAINNTVAMMISILVVGLII